MNEATIRTCAICHERKAASEFPLRAKDGTRRHSYCNPCRNTYRRSRRAAEQRENLHQFTQLLASGRAHDRMIFLLVDRLFQRFGGVDRFVAAWWEHLQAAQEEKPGQRFVCNSFTAIVRLWQMAEQYRQKHQRPLDDLSEQELDALYEELVADVSRAASAGG